MNTPRTDLETFFAMDRPVNHVVLADFARQLETELSEAKEYEQRLRSELIQARKQAQDCDQLRAEVDAYRNGGVTEELLRRQDGLIKVGKGCEIAIEGTTAKRDQWRECAEQLAKKYRSEMIMLFGHAKDCDCDRCNIFAAYEQLKGT